MTTLELELVRRWFTEQSTIGELTMPGYSCFILEDRVRAPGVKVYGATAIPPGRYAVRVSMSPKFQKRLPELIAVPNFTGIRIHAGNTAANTEGCLLTGTERGDNFVRFSRAAFYPLLERLEAAQALPGRIAITITEEPDVAFEAARAALLDPLPTYRQLIAA